MSNKVYDVLKIVSMIVIPITVCIAAIVNAITTGGSLENVILAIGEAIAAALGAILAALSKNYWKDRTVS